MMNESPMMRQHWTMMKMALARTMMARRQRNLTELQTMMNLKQQVMTKQMKNLKNPPMN